MARTKVDDIIVLALGRRRSEVAAKIEAHDPDRLTTLQDELVELETALKDVDSTIPSLEEERFAAEAAVRAVEEANIAEATRAVEADKIAREEEDRLAREEADRLVQEAKEFVPEK